MNRDSARVSRPWFRDGAAPAAPRQLAFGLLTRVVVIAALVMLLLSRANPGLIEPLRETVVAPFRSILTVAAGPVSGAFATIVDLSGRVAQSRERASTRLDAVADLSAQVADLRRKNADLARDNADLQRINAGLSALVPMVGNRSYGLHSAAVIGGSASGATSRILIAAGREDGIRPGYPVMMAGCLLGRVHTVHASTSVVVRLSDRLSRVPVLVGAGETRALLVGSGHGSAVLELIGHGPAPAEDDPVVTSGVGGVFPRGLMVGRVLAKGDAATGRETGSAATAVRVGLYGEAAYEPIAGVMMIDGAVFDQSEQPGRQSAYSTPDYRVGRNQTTGTRASTAILARAATLAAIDGPAAP